MSSMCHLPATPSIPVLIPGTSLNVPLATPGRLDAGTLSVYAALGLETVVLLVDGLEYTVPVDHVASAKAALVRRVAPIAGGVAADPRTTVAVPRPSVQVPDHQPRADPSVVRVYEALGIDVVNVVLGAGTAEAVHTVRTDSVAAARSWVKHQAECESAGHCHTPASRPCPIAGVTLQDHYVGDQPPVTDRVLARLFGARFLRVLAPVGGMTYWVLKGPAGVEATLTRLGLYE